MTASAVDRDDRPVGPCVGGPMDGKRCMSRFPRGFLLVDKPAAHAWLYDWDPAAGVFRARQDEPMPAHTEGPKNRYRAAEEGEFDVVAAPWVGEPS